MSETSFTLTIEPELHAQLLAEADAAHRPPAEVLHELVEAFVTRQKEARDYNVWFRAAVEEAFGRPMTRTR